MKFKYVEKSKIEQKAIKSKNEKKSRNPWNPKTRNSPKIHEIQGYQKNQT